MSLIYIPETIIDLAVRKKKTNIALTWLKLRNLLSLNYGNYTEGTEDLMSHLLNLSKKVFSNHISKLLSLGFLKRALDNFKCIHIVSQYGKGKNKVGITTDAILNSFNYTSKGLRDFRALCVEMLIDMDSKKVRALSSYSKKVEITLRSSRGKASLDYWSRDCSFKRRPISVLAVSAISGLSSSTIASYRKKIETFTDVTYHHRKEATDLNPSDVESLNLSILQDLKDKKISPFDYGKYFVNSQGRVIKSFISVRNQEDVLCRILKKSKRSKRKSSKDFQSTQRTFKDSEIPFLDETESTEFSVLKRVSSKSSGDDLPEFSRMWAINAKEVTKKKDLVFAKISKSEPLVGFKSLKDCKESGLLNLDSEYCDHVIKTIFG